MESPVMEPVRCPRCGSDEKAERFVVSSFGRPEDGTPPYDCDHEWHDEEPHASGCICADHSDEPYKEA